MSEWRKDPFTERWTIVAPERAGRPYEFGEGEETRCPFCEGMETLTPPEVFSIRRDGTMKNQPGWFVRVFPNKYPALQRDIPFWSMEDGFHRAMSGFGVHEVIVETPHHAVDFSELPEEQIVRVLTAYRERLRHFAGERELRYGLIFKNQGVEAGASMSHAHSQFVATPVIPQAVCAELQSAKAFYSQRGKCLFCTLLEQERKKFARIVFESEHFVALVPYAARLPFEVVVFPVHHSATFLEETRLEDLAQTLRRVLQSVRECSGGSAFNFVLHSVPYHAQSEEHRSYHWHFEILPSFPRMAGFEWGSGFSINVLPPEEAASRLRLCLGFQEGE
jgi:UDPglucose--hexose-1-phosphate uridylyltransferase